MKPASRIQATIDILEVIAARSIPMDACLGDYMRSRRYIGAKDRREVAERVYDMTRAQARLGWWLKKLGAEDTVRARAIAHLALAEGADEKRFKDLFDGSKYAPEEFSDEEKIFAGKVIGQNLDHPDMPVAVRVECPPDYEKMLRDYFGDDFESEMLAMLKPATLDLRVNTFVLEREQAKASLEKDGVSTTETPYSPWGLRCENKAYLSKTKAFSKGWIEIQDEGSQMIAHICGAAPGMQVLDYCAGGGGKTLALAAAMQRKGRIVAMDTDEKRLERGRLRYKKSHLSDIIEVRALSDEKQRKWLKRQKQKFDVVLTDVPCSGTGTWRRNPDMRWNTYGPGLEDLKTLQLEILEKASGAVKPGGRLVYATCSLLPEENEAQVEAFLKANPEFEIQPVAKELGNPYMRLTTHRHQTDGFFAAAMVRKPD